MKLMKPKKKMRRNWKIKKKNKNNIFYMFIEILGKINRVKKAAAFPSYI